MANKKKAAGPQVIVKVKGGIDPKSKALNGQPIAEDGVLYQPGDQFTIDADRADALSHVVDLVGPVPAAADEKE